MKILIDSHIFLWLDAEPERLSLLQQNPLKDRSNEIYLSIASLWELQIKINLGKLSVRAELPELIEEQQRENGLILLPIHLIHIYALNILPSIHRDTFDRILIAQAQVDNLAMMTVDENIKRHPILVIA